MSQNPITVIIPTYKRPQMLTRAVQSVLNQTYGNFQVRIYDNCSGDQTAVVCEALSKQDSRVQYFQRPQNIGAYLNWVGAAGQVETPYFSFLPDDDLMLPHFLEQAIAGFNRYPDAAVSLLATMHVNPEGFVRDAWVMDWPEEGLLCAPKGMLFCLRYGNPGLPAMLIRRDVWETLGGFDEAVAPCDDLDFQLRGGAKFHFVVSRTPGAIQVMHEEAQTARADLRWVWPPIPRIIQKIVAMDLPLEAKEEALTLLSRWLDRGLFVRGGIRAICDGNWDDAERAATLLATERSRRKAATLIRLSSSLSKRTDLARKLLVLLFRLRNFQKTIRNTPRARRFPSYRHLLELPATAVPIQSIQ